MEIPYANHWRILVKGEDQTYLFLHPAKIEEMDSFRGDIVKLTSKVF